MAVVCAPLDIEVDTIAVETGTMEVTTSLIDIGSGTIFRGPKPDDMLDL